MKSVHRFIPADRPEGRLKEGDYIMEASEAIISRKHKYLPLKVPSQTVFSRPWQQSTSGAATCRF